VALALCAMLVGAASALAQPTTLAPPTVLAGPSSAIDGLGGMSIARDGTGGLVFTEQIAGADHVYVSRLEGGSFQAPQQVDGGLSGPSSQPVIAAANGGVLLVAFINGGTLYVADAASTTSPFTAPQPLAAGASNPAISVNNFPKAYLAFTVTDGAGDDVRSAFYDAGRWALEPTALNVTPADDAGTGTGRPAVAAAGDGVAIVAWGENGHIDARRVWGTSPSIGYERVDPSSVSGWSEVSADEPSVSAGGDSSYADVGFRATLQNGAATQTRALMSWLIADSIAQTHGIDGLGTPAGDGGQEPQVVTGEYGRGFALSAQENSHELFAMALGTNGFPGAVARVDTGEVNVGDPLAVGATAGLYSTVAAWQETPVSGSSEVMVSFGTDGTTLGPPVLASAPGDGPTDAAAGLAAAGDVAGDAAAAWVQGTGVSTTIVAAQLYQPPGSFGPVDKAAYANTSKPTFSWSAARESWGPVRYVVTANGVVIGSTSGLSLRPSTPLPDGPYTWQVTAVNQGGGKDIAHPATVHIDTLAPLVDVAIAGVRRVSSTVRLTVTYTDLRPGEPAADSSGIVASRVSWGDGTSQTLRPHATRPHVYARAGLYNVTVRVADRAGNVTTVVRHLRILRPARRGKRSRHGR
jgi:hypothetical protein